MVPVGPLQFNLECAGTGEPPVILEAGSGDSLVVWDPIAATVGGFTRTCAYDRPGLGHSPPRASQAPVTADQQAGDLHALLEAAGLHGPYVLVGHSHGATIVRVYAGKYPGDVAGLVLVDPMIQSLMHDTRLDGFDLLDLDASREQVQAAHLPDVPLVVLTAGGDPNGGSPEGIRDHEAIAAQVPRGRHIVVPGAPHTIHSAQPTAVVDAIREVVEAARTGGR
jgi:pimeloyl-ACP methyl ester carboxylesterase